MMHKFKDRDEAGAQLGVALSGFKGTNSIVLALPRGGVPVGHRAARALELPFEVLGVRKLGVPGHEEFAFGAIGEAGATFIDKATVRALGISETEISVVLSREHQRLEERLSSLRGSRPFAAIAGKTALIVDDGLATGSTARAACVAARRLGASSVVIAVPVAPIGMSPKILGSDELVTLSRPTFFNSVGEHYENFDQVTDDEVLALLNEWRAATS